MAAPTNIFCNICGKQLVETSSGLYCINLNCRPGKRKQKILVLEENNKNEGVITWH